MISPCHLLRISLLGLLSVVCTVDLSAGWVPVDCHERPDAFTERRESAGFDAETWQRFRHSVRGASPEDPTYAPHPYPKTDEQVVADFLYAYFEVVYDDRSLLDSEEAVIYDALKAGELALEVVRVENWGTTRCHPRQPVPFYFVVRLADKTGIEVARGVLHHTGLFSRYTRLTGKGAPLDLSGAGVAADRLLADLGVDISVQSPQYVTTDGLPYRCLPQLPCISFKSGPSLYFLTPEPLLYEVGATEVRWPITDFLTRLRQQGQELGLGGREYDHPLVSLGIEGAVARRVAGRPTK